MGHGLGPGRKVDFVIQQAADPVGALRLKPARLFVVRGGRVIAETPSVASRMTLGGEAPCKEVFCGFPAQRLIAEQD